MTSEEKRIVENVSKRLGLSMSAYVKKLLFDNLYFEIEDERLERERRKVYLGGEQEEGV